MRYGSVCSGIEAASVAWEPLGWRPAFFSEIDKFPSRVLAHRYGSNMPGEPLANNGIPNYGDFTKIGALPGPVDLLVGGTPCQSFSVAGKRLGMDDPRGNLALEFLGLARRLRARWLVWENVPGVLSSFSGAEHTERAIWEGDVGGFADGLEERDFATFLSFVLECGYGFAWRVLDAQYVRVDGFAGAVPQRRRRVFVVGYLGDWRRAAAVLLEPEGMRRDPAPRRKAGQGPAGTLAARAGGGGGLGTDFEAGGGLIPAISPTLRAGINRTGGHRPPGTDVDTCETLIAHMLRGAGFDASEDGTGRGTPIVPVSAFRTSSNCGARETGERVDALTTGTDPNSHLIAFSSKDFGADAMHGVCPTLRSGNHDASHANGGVPPAVAFDLRGRAGGSMPEGPHDTANIRAANGGSSRSYVAEPWAVRRLTPLECERLQGFPDGWTDIGDGKGGQTPDGPRYAACGNSMAVNVMRWIGVRIAAAEAVCTALDSAGKGKAGEAQGGVVAHSSNRTCSRARFEGERK